MSEKPAEALSRRAFINLTALSLLEWTKIHLIPFSRESAASPGSEHQLHTRDHFIELVIPEFRMGGAEIGPGVNVIDHQLDIVAVDVVVDPTGDGQKPVAPLFSWIKTPHA